MAEFRTLDQISKDFRLQTESVGEDFTQVRDFDYLRLIITDNRLSETASYAAGDGPILFDLGVLDSPDWETVRRFLNARQLVSLEASQECQHLEADLRAADSNHDGFVNNQELVAFVQANSDRWANIQLFRGSADVFLNRLPAYLSQRNITPQQTTDLWHALNYFAEQSEKSGINPDHRLTVYGISLEGFPSYDEKNKPDIIVRADQGKLTPEELAAVHQILKIQYHSDKTLSFDDSAPLSPKELTNLQKALTAASQKGMSFRGMKILSGKEEVEFFGPKERAETNCMEGIVAAQTSSDPYAVPKAFSDCATAMAPIEVNHPEQISSSLLYTRARVGDLSAGETRELRQWMHKNGVALGLTPCDGTASCLVHGAKQTAKGIWENKFHFLLRNGAFIGGTYLYRRMLLRNAFTKRLESACDGQVINPKKTFGDYERSLAKNRSVAGKVINQVFNNPRLGGFFKKVFLNFPISFGHIAAFNYIASKKDTGHDWIDIPTDLPLILLFEGWDTYNAFNNASIQQFAAKNPGVCKPSEAAETEVSPEMVIEEQPAEAANPVSEFSMFPEAATLSSSSTVRNEDTMYDLSIGAPLIRTRTKYIWQHSTEIDGRIYAIDQAAMLRTPQLSILDGGSWTTSPRGGALAFSPADDVASKKLSDWKAQNQSAQPKVNEDGYDEGQIQAVAVGNQRAGHLHDTTEPLPNAGSYQGTGASSIVFAAPTFSLGVAPATVPLMGEAPALEFVFE